MNRNYKLKYFICFERRDTIYYIVMSIFPAFSNELEKPTRAIINSVGEPEKESWLENSSYSCDGASSEKLPEKSVKFAVSRDNDSSTVQAKRSRSDSPHRHHRKKKKKESSKTRKELKKDEKRNVLGSKSTFQDHPSVKFYEDRVKRGGNLTVSTLHRPAVPLYSRRFWIPFGVKHNSSIRSWKLSGREGRYFVADLTDGKINASDEEKKETMEESEWKAGEEVVSEFINWETSRLEKEVRHATKSFSQRLVEKPHDVQVWLEFIRFQERASELQFRGGFSKTALAKRKLDILEKALRENPRSWLLMREKTHLEQILYPADELEEKLGKEAKKSNGLLPWLAFLEVLRIRETTSDVCNNYGKAMETAQREGRALQKRIGSSSVTCDERIIDLFFSCGLYMRQAGQWERLLTLIKMYLEFNLTPASNDNDGGKNVCSNVTFDFGRQPNDAEVDELETEVLKSGLPLSEMWLRVESLRQSVRWMPLSPSDKNETDGDLQRIVFPEDVSELFHPLLTVGRPSSRIIARLASVTLLLLKVPLLPCRDTAVRRHAFPSWNCDTPEVHLTAVFSGGPWEWGKRVLPLDLLGEMIAGGGGPQYLLPRPGRDLYLESVRKLFLILTDVAGSSTDQQYFGVWWLRFERWLIILEGCKCPKINFSLPQTWKKQLKSTLKEFLSKEKNRSSLALYREYALLEAALVKEESSIRTLCTAAALGRCPVVGAKERSELCSVYRTLAELLLKQGIDKMSESQNVKSSFPTSSDFSNDERHVLKQKSIATIAEEENRCIQSKIPENVSKLEVSSRDHRDVILERQKGTSGNGNCSNSRLFEEMQKETLGHFQSKDIDDVNSGESCSDRRKDTNVNDLITSNPTASYNAIDGNRLKYSGNDIEMVYADSCISVEQVLPGCNNLVGSADSTDILSLNVKDVDTTVGTRSRWDMRNPSVGTGGRRPRWTASGIFMGSVFCDDEANNMQSNQTKSCKVNVRKSEVGRSRREKVSKDLGLDFGSKGNRISDSLTVSSSLCEQKAITVLTCLGLGKPLVSLEKIVDKSEIDQSLQKYKHVTREILEGEENGRCTCQEFDESGCKCGERVGVDGGGGGMECFRSYFLVEWICCRAWLLCLVESVWAGGGVFEEVLTKIDKIPPEQMEDVDNDACNGSETLCGRYNPTIVRARNIREALYEGYITMLLSRRWSQEARSGTNVILADVIRRALGEFPENMCFAAAVAITENEAGYGGSPWWLVTSYFDGGLGRAGGSSTPSLFGKVFLVLLAEQRRRRREEGEKMGHQMMDLGGPIVSDRSGTNRLHSVLRRLVADVSTRSCPLLWRLYIRFVGAVVGVNECKGVAYRGLQQCQWIKAFYLDAACLLPEEINQFQDLITEKELRLHVSPEELEILRT